MGNSSSKDKKLNKEKKQDEISSDKNLIFNDIFRINLIHKINENKNNKEYLFKYFVLEWYNVNKDYNVLKNNSIINLLVNHLNNFFEPYFKQMCLSICGYVNDNVKGLLDEIINYSIISFNLYLYGIGIKECSD